MGRGGEGKGGEVKSKIEMGGEGKESGEDKR